MGAVALELLGQQQLRSYRLLVHLSHPPVGVRQCCDVAERGDVTGRRGAPPCTLVSRDPATPYLGASPVDPRLRQAAGAAR
jgi:hypothetical protein